MNTLPETLPDIAAETRDLTLASPEQLQQALTNLPDEQALLIQESYYAQKTHTMIAKEQHWPLGTVKSRLRLALVNLRRALAVT